MEFHEVLRDTWQTALVFLSLLVFTRFLGKTQVGQLTFYEYISGITIGSIAGNIIAAEQEKFIPHFYDLILFVALTYLLSVTTIKNRYLRHIIEGSATIIIENGKILRDNMKSLRYDLDELNAQLRQQGILDISEVQFAIFETTGELSIIKKVQDQPVSKKDLNITPQEIQMPIELIMDGEIIHKNLVKQQISREWLDAQLQNQNIISPHEVMYAGLDSQGQFFLIKK
ncbi:YetF domain-containing protein [Anaerosinus gibii]|uniref:DUF421 domain-containing protein n=1 Tax=Selenobaculum gibii TaxID=3054208 RepID=A0A9Y2ETG1_9FIRM|nr:DUF421 domain-containing protein [Selenobaculum gbiensis]WIW69950.1 DUF421 domain-containing protein [Selenobaculum gbiensis]